MIKLDVDRILRKEIRTFENARLIGKNLCQLNRMSDIALESSLTDVNKKFNIGPMDFSNFKPTAWGAADSASDISKDWAKASKAAKGFPIK